MFEYMDQENGQLALSGLTGLPVGKGKLVVQKVPALMAATLLKPVKVGPRVCICWVCARMEVRAYFSIRWTALPSCVCAFEEAGGLGFKTILGRRYIG